MILFEKNNIQLEYHSEEDILEVRWIGALEVAMFEQMWGKAVEIANEYAVENILLDATYVEASNSPGIYEARIQRYFQQKLPIPSVKKIARVSAGQAPYDQDILSLYLTLQNRSHLSFEFKNFEHQYEAIQWLTES